MAKKVTYIVVREGEYLLVTTSIKEATARAEKEDTWQQEHAEEWGATPARIWIETRK